MYSSQRNHVNDCEDEEERLHHYQSSSGFDPARQIMIQENRFFPEQQSDEEQSQEFDLLQ